MKKLGWAPKTKFNTDGAPDKKGSKNSTNSVRVIRQKLQLDAHHKTVRSVVQREGRFKYTEYAVIPLFSEDHQKIATGLRN